MASRRAFIQGMAALTGMAITPVMGQVGFKPVKARYWHAGDNDAVACELCPHACILQDGATGICRVRQNKGGVLITNGYANPCAMHVDPIEKKPFYHVMPGTTAYSIAVAGCNFRCKNCQNYTISQSSPLETANEYLPPQEVVKRAVQSGCRSIAYTYSEPTVWFEYMYDTSVLARKAGLKNVWVTAGFINPAPLKELAGVMDAVTLDVKGFSDESYRTLNSGRLQPVLDTLKNARANGIWVEVSNLVVPELTDSMEGIRQLCAWVVQNLGATTPLHFLRFTPMYKLANLYPTPEKTLRAAAAAARKAGLKFVYLGNVPGSDDNTCCPSCGKPVIERQGYLLRSVSVKHGACAFCGAKMPGVWEG